MKSTSGWLWGAAVFAVPVLWFIVVGRDRLAEIDRLTTELRRASNEVPALEAESARKREVDAELVRLREWHAELQGYYTAPTGGMPLLLGISDLMRSFDLELERSSGTPSEPRPSLVTEAVQAVMRGTFADVVRFVREIESTPPLTRIRSLHVRRAADDDPRVRVELTIERYRQVDA